MNIEYPYLVVSDVHFHAWDFGSYINPDGVNSRLQDTINEFRRAANVLDEQGGKDIVITGDLFHTRGEIKPSVYNPVYDMFKDLSERGFNVHAIPGNHDLETEETTEEGCTFKSFGGLAGFKIHYKTHGYTNFTTKEKFIFIPWTEYFASSLDQVDTTSSYSKTIFAHVGLNDVVNGLKGSFKAEHFNRIVGLKHAFCGHYHNHKRFDLDDGYQQSSVFSVGALTHQSFKDVGSSAGFIIVESREKVTFHNSEAPEFVDYTDDDWTSASDGSKFTGNFARMKFEGKTTLTREEVAAIKVTLEAFGALRVVNRVEIVEDDIGPLVSPAAYMFGKTNADSLGKEFVEYVKSRYDTAMATRMIEIFEKDGIDES